MNDCNSKLDLAALVKSRLPGHSLPQAFYIDSSVANLDLELCEYAQTGVSSSSYRPGPYSTYKEYNVDTFERWYLGALAQ